MNVVAVASPQYCKADNSQINCQVTFDNGQTYPYTSTAIDNAPYGPSLWEALNNGEYGTIAPFSG